jgi:hypothetical protein
LTALQRVRGGIDLEFEESGDADRPLVLLTPGAGAAVLSHLNAAPCAG